MFQHCRESVFSVLRRHKSNAPNKKGALQRKSFRQARLLFLIFKSGAGDKMKDLAKAVLLFPSFWERGKPLSSVFPGQLTLMADRRDI